MLGLIIGLGLAVIAGYAIHNKKMSNSYIVAKALEHGIDSDKKLTVNGYFDESEVIRIMAEDDYDYFANCRREDQE